MRVKKQKRHRKIVKFYTACFAFRQPYKVVLDGTFVYHAVTNQITSVDKALSTALGAPVKLFTTKCVIEELKRLGESHFEALRLAHQLPIARCEHERKMSADACIIDIIGEKNSEHFFVASQDVDLRKKLQEIPGVPLVYGLRNTILLEPPSSSQRQFVKSSEEDRSRMTESERKMLSKRAKDVLENDEVQDSDEDERDEMLGKQTAKMKDNKRKQLGVKDGPQFKRKKAKGPNPLSCKKKKSHENPNKASGKENNNGSDTVRSRSRKRKRTRKTADTSS